MLLKMYVSQCALVRASTEICKNVSMLWHVRRLRCVNHSDQVSEYSAVCKSVWSGMCFSWGVNVSLLWYATRLARQGYIIGPGLFTLYTRPIGQIIRRHRFDFHHCCWFSIMCLIFNTLITIPLHLHAYKHVLKNWKHGWFIIDIRGMTATLK